MNWSRRIKDGLEKEFKIILNYLMTNNTIQTRIVKKKLDIMFIGCHVVSSQVPHNPHNL